MRALIRMVGLFLVSGVVGECAEPVAKQFLRFVYGADGIQITNICHPSDDAWMLRGAKNPAALAQLDAMTITGKVSGVTSGILGRDIYFVETREGKVDPAFNLDGIYVMHRQLVQRFLYAALLQDRAMLGRLVTDASKVQMAGPKAAAGDMDQYASILELIPVVRASKPVEDAKSKTVTYRVPLGEEVLAVTLVKEGSTWKIDTSQTVRVPLEFFFR